jgi:hypothetical protein
MFPILIFAGLATGIYLGVKIKFNRAMRFVKEAL